MEAAPHALMLSEDPLRAKRRELQAQLEARRDEIAALDLEIETLREALAAFEVAVQAQLARENKKLARIRGILEHLDRWCRLLRERARAPDKFGMLVGRVEARRVREVQREQEEQISEHTPPPPPPIEEALKPPPVADELKTLYRSLARRFHPDLARTEEERVRFGGLMARINQLYADRDLDRLRALAEQMKGGEIEDEDEDIEIQIKKLQERLIWFDRVLGNLRDERREMEKYPTCILLRRAEEAQAKGRDAFADLRRELNEDYERALRDVPYAARRLEAEVERFNKEALHSALEVKGRSDLDRVFDPFANKSLMRTGLIALKAANASPAAREKAGWLESLAEENRPLLRLILFTYASDLASMPLPGLDKLQDLRARFDYVSNGDRTPPIEELLADAVTILEYGVRKVSETRMRTGLRFRDETVREAVPLAIRSQGVKAEFRRVLEALGDRGRCEGCSHESYAVPLFRTRGLDDLRAAVCAACGHTLRSYWMPRGDDVQSVLNDAFVELEVVTEWSFRVSRASIAMQLLPIQVDGMTVGELKQRFHRDVIERNGVEVAPNQISLVQGKNVIAEETPLTELEVQAFAVRFDEAAPVSAADALELIRYRIRHRFRPES